MVTTLKIERTDTNSIGNILGNIKGDSYNIDVKKLGDIIVREVTYRQRGKRLNLRKLHKAVGGQSSCLLCDQMARDTEIFEIFSSNIFTQRLCSNFALKLVQMLGEINSNLKVGIIDYDSNCIDIVRPLLSVCDKLTVVTQSIEEYMYISDEILMDMGATFLLTKNFASLNVCDLIIAPSKIDVPLSLKDRCVVITTELPTYMIGGQIYFEYDIDLPSEIELLRPKWCSAIEFGSALYIAENLYTLGSVVPKLCRSESVVQTLPSMVKMLNNLVA